MAAPRGSRTCHSQEVHPPSQHASALHRPRQPPPPPSGSQWGGSDAKVPISFPASQRPSDLSPSCQPPNSPCVVEPQSLAASCRVSVQPDPTPSADRSPQPEPAVRSRKTCHSACLPSQSPSPADAAALSPTRRTPPCRVPQSGSLPSTPSRARSVPITPSTARPRLPLSESARQRR